MQILNRMCTNARIEGCALPNRCFFHLFGSAYFYIIEKFFELSYDIKSSSQRWNLYEAFEQSIALDMETK